MHLNSLVYLTKYLVAWNLHFLRMKCIDSSKQHKIHLHDSTIMVLEIEEFRCHQNVPAMHVLQLTHGSVALVPSDAIFLRIVDTNC